MHVTGFEKKKHIEGNRGRLFEIHNNKSTN